MHFAVFFVCFCLLSYVGSSLWRIFYQGIASTARGQTDFLRRYPVDLEIVTF